MMGPNEKMFLDLMSGCARSLTLELGCIPALESTVDSGEIQTEDGVKTGSFGVVGIIGNCTITRVMIDNYKDDPKLKRDDCFEAAYQNLINQLIFSIPHHEVNNDVEYANVAGLFEHLKDKGNNG